MTVKTILRNKGSEVISVRPQLPLVEVARILVQRSIASEFIDRFVARTKRIRVGDPLSPATEVGPLAFEGHMQRVLDYTKVARADGAQLLTGGARAAIERGWFVEPTAVLAPSNDARVCQEEIFGPFATFLEFDTLDEAIDIANRSRFGLVSYVWSDDLPTTMRCSREIRAGTVWVNNYRATSFTAPFGGYKHSGIGRESGVDAVREYLETKCVWVSTDLDVANPFIRR